MPLFSAATAARLKDIRQDGFDTVRMFHDDTYVCWTVNRPAGWADTVSVEAQAVVESGTGKLYANGAGAPVTSEMVISIESPFRFRTTASSAIEPGHLLVINGNRLFRADAVKREDVADKLMDVYLSELFKTPMPEVP